MMASETLATAKSTVRHLLHPRLQQTSATSAVRSRHPQLHRLLQMASVTLATSALPVLLDLPVLLYLLLQLIMLGLATSATVRPTLPHRLQQTSVILVPLKMLRCS